MSYDSVIKKYRPEHLVDDISPAVALRSWIFFISQTLLCSVRNSTSYALWLIHEKVPASSSEFPAYTYCLLMGEHVTYLKGRIDGGMFGTHGWKKLDVNFCFTIAYNLIGAYKHFGTPCCLHFLSSQRNTGCL
jgi:hypothetical protein